MTGNGYQTAIEHFEEHGRRLAIFLKIYILRTWRRLTDGEGRLDPGRVSLGEVLGTLGLSGEALGLVAGELDPEAWGPTIASLEQELAQWGVHIQRRLEETDDGVPLPIEDLRAFFKLDPTSLDVVLLVARLQSSADFHRLCRFAWGETSREQPQVAFVVEALGLTAEDQTRLRQVCGPTGVLRRLGLLLVSDVPGWIPSTPLLFQQALVPDRLVHYLLGDTPTLSSAVVTLVQPPARAPEAHIPAEVIHAAGTAIAEALGASGRTLIVLRGPQGVGKVGMVAALTDRLGRRLARIDLDALWSSPPEGLRAKVTEALLESVLLDAFPLLDFGSRVCTPEVPDDQVRIDALRRAIEVHEGLLFVSSVASQVWLEHEPVLDEIHLPYTSLLHQREVWCGALDGLTLDDGLTVDYLANRFNLTAGNIDEVVRSALRTAGPSFAGRKRSRVVRERDLVSAARRQLRHKLGTLSEPMYTEFQWDDIILPERLKSQLRDIERRIKHQMTVYNAWGFRALAGGERGLSVLFSGPPGTGKTVTACVLGRALGRDVFRVDLSMVVSKYIGETEKNLARLFDESEYAPIMLLFDEADSLFTNRTQVKDSHDRFANMQVNFLLQRIESFEGVCILTTNHIANIDEAFKRRLDMIVEFPAPDLQTREELWRQMMPATARLSDDIKWDKLAGAFDFAGGHIRNAILRAAFFAAEADEPICHAHLFDAAVKEARQLGHLVRG